MGKKKNKKSKTRLRDEFDNYVEHPRYGRYPHFTGDNPDTTIGGEVFIHWHSPENLRIPDTAIKADLSKQQEATIPVTHYYDVRRVCRDCNRPFIFFAREQKHWYEELGFGLDSDCVRCVPCRKKQQGLAQKQERYEELFHVPDKTPEQILEMAQCSLSLIEDGVFNPRQGDRIRHLLKQIPDDCDEKTRTSLKAIRERLKATGV